MLGVISVIRGVDKTKVIYIRCKPETYKRMRVLFSVSGEKNYEEFLDKLLRIYDRLRKQTGIDSLDQILDRLDYYDFKAIVVDGI